MIRKNNLVLLISVVFFFSGFSALIFKTLWFQIASIVLGSSVHSAAAVLCSFMAGLGIGNLIVAMYGHKISNPIKFYMAIEVIIGFSGIFVIWCLPAISPLLTSAMSHLTELNSWLNFSRFLIGFSFMLIPSICMGMTIPLLQKFLDHSQHNFSRSLGILYGVNTLGAVFGVIATEFLLIKYLGIKHSGLFALFINLFIVLMLIRVFKTSDSHSIEDESRINTKLIFSMHSTLLVPFLTGFILLALEVIWFRYLLLAHSGTSHIFAFMLIIVLSGIGIGGLISAKINMNETKIINLSTWLPMISALVLTLCFFSFTKIFGYYYHNIEYNITLFVLSSIVLMLPICILSGIMFPIFGSLIYMRLKHTSGATGLLTFTNTLGAALGSGMATFAMLPHLGIERSLLVLCIAYMATSFIVLLKHQTKKPWAPTLITAVISVGLFPYGSLDQIYKKADQVKFKNSTLVKVVEGLNETLQYYKSEKFQVPTSFTLVTNNFSMSSTNFHGKRYMKLYAYFPYLFNREIKDVLQISYGVGNTAEAITRLNSMERFDVVDISKDIIDYSKIIHDATGIYPLNDPRTKIHIEDGRFFLQTTKRKYDLITGEPPPPKNAGVVNLYSKEYFQLIEKSLKSKGIVTYWLPVHDLLESDTLSIVKAFCDVFEDCSLWSGSGLDFMLVGSKDGIDPITDHDFNSAWQSEIANELKETGFEYPGMVGSMFLADHYVLKKLTVDVLPLSDNYPHRLSPSLSGLREHSLFYKQLLDIDRRKVAFNNSEYIQKIFPKSVIKSTQEFFKYEAIYKNFYAMYYTDPNLNYWQILIDLLLETKQETLPLVMLSTSPEERKLLKNIGDDKLFSASNNISYAIHLAKISLVDREFEKAAEYLKQHISLTDLSLLNDSFLTQLYLVTQGLAGEVEQSMLVSLNNVSSLDPNFLRWHKKWLVDDKKNNIDH